jgi:hypothetical protein
MRESSRRSRGMLLLKKPRITRSMHSLRRRVAITSNKNRRVKKRKKKWKSPSNKIRRYHEEKKRSYRR